VILRGPKTQPLLAQVFELIKDFKAATGCKQLPADLHTKFSDWLRLPSTALETSTKVAAAALPVLAPAGGSRLSPRPTRTPTWDVDKAAGQAYYSSLIKRLPIVGTPEFRSLVSQAKSALKVEHEEEIKSASVLYIINKLALLSREWGNSSSGRIDVTCFNQLHIFLRTLAKPEEHRADNLIQFFITMFIGMDLHKSPSLTTEATPSPNEVDPVFMYLLHRILMDQAGYVYEPKLDAPGMVEPTASPSIPPKQTAPRDREDDSLPLLKAYNAGCIAAEQLAKMTRLMSNCVNVTLDRVVIGDIDQKFIDTLKASYRQGIKLDLQKSRLIGTTSQVTIQLSIKNASFFLNCLEADRYLCELNRQYGEFAAHSAGTVKRLEAKLQAIQAAAESSPERRSLQFSLVREYCEEILNDRKLTLSYVEEIIGALEQAILLTELKAYLIIFRNDPRADRSLLVTKGFQSTLLEYKDINPMPNLTTLSPEDSATALSSFQNAGKSKNLVLALTQLHKELRRSNEQIDRTYLDGFTHLLKLHKSGSIVIDEATGLPAFRATPLAALAWAEVAEAPVTASVEEPLVREALAEAGVKADPSAVMKLPSGADLLRSLEEIAPISHFTVIEARDAYCNALHYIESLYELLTEPQTIGRDAESVAHLQMDIGFAAFHALEQLLTAFMLQKSRTSPLSMGHGKVGVAAKEDNSALFNEMGHRLIRRLLEAKILGPDSVRSLLKKTEAMEFAIRDLLKRDINPPLLKNTAYLLARAEGSALAIPREEKKSYTYGYKALEAFTSLLSLGTSNHRATDHLDLFFKAARASIPAAARAGHSESPSDTLPTAGKISAPPTSTKASSTLPVDVVHEDIAAELITTIQNALEKAKNKESAMSRGLTLIHNLHRCNHLMKCVLGNSKLELFPFYVNQARFVLRTIMEEFLCAALENQRGSNLDQEEQTHRLQELASALKLTSIGPEEINFLMQSASIRNEARYGHKVKAHSLASAVSRFEIAATGLEVPESASELGLDLEFERVLGDRYASMRKELLQEFAIVKSLCDKISSQFFKEEKKAGGGVK
jgi:hypothetical protein